MISRQSTRARRSRPVYMLEPVESRTLFSASYATLVLDAPRLPALPVQVDHNATQTPPDPNAINDASLDIQVRVVAGGIQLTVAASSANLMKLAPTGTVDLYDDVQFLGTVALGSAVRSTLVLAPGKHTFFATYTGDTNFHPSQTSIVADLPVPSSTLPANPADANTYATNSEGERIRASRFLSNINFFDIVNLNASATPQVVSALPPVPGVANASPFTLAPGDPIPNPRFSKITFSLKLPKISGSH